MSEEEAIKEIENYLDYEGSVSIQAIATLYTSYNKEKEERQYEKELRLKYERRYDLAIENRKKNFISKSKVREKIEEYKELVKEFEEYWSKDPRQFKKEKSCDYYKIEVLQELLQEGDDK